MINTFRDRKRERRFGHGNAQYKHIKPINSSIFRILEFLRHSTIATAASRPVTLLFGLMVYCVWGAKCQCDKGSCFENDPWVEKGNAVVVVVVG